MVVFFFVFFLFFSFRFLTVVLASSPGLQVYDVGISAWVDVASVEGADAVVSFLSYLIHYTTKKTKENRILRIP
jgi:hypothetical protein